MRNVLCSFAIYVAAVVCSVLAYVLTLMLVIVASIFSEIIFLVATVALVCTGPILCVLLGYKFLVPLPKRNMLSVLSPAFFLLVITVLISTMLSSAGSLEAYEEVAFLLYPGNYALLTLLTWLVGWKFWSDGLGFFVVLASSFLPSFLMYLGLRLKIRAQNTSVLIEENNNE